MINSNTCVWKDELLELLGIKNTNENYSVKEISKIISEKYKFNKKYNFIYLDENSKSVLKLENYNNKLRLSVLLNHICNNFLVLNDEPKEFYYHYNNKIQQLDNNQINQIMESL